MSARVTTQVKERSPLITSAGMAMLERIRQHAHAPRWNHAAGDRLTRADLAALDTYRRMLSDACAAKAAGPPSWLVEWVEARRSTVPSFRERIPKGFQLKRDWHHLATTGREEVALRPL